MPAKDTEAQQRQAPPIQRLRLVVFALLLALVASAAAALKLWGRDWVAAAYEPILLEDVAGDLANDRYGMAEKKLLSALATTPDYAYFLLDTFTPQLPVMPELAFQLKHVFERGLQHENHPEKAARYLARLAALDTGAQRANERAPYESLRQTLPPDSGSSHHQYLLAVADLALGDLDAAERRLTALAEKGEFMPDTAYRLGQVKELRGKTDEALAWYERAILASESHLDAARAYLRLSENRP